MCERFEQHISREKCKWILLYHRFNCLSRFCQIYCPTPSTLLALLLLLFYLMNYIKWIPEVIFHLDIWYASLKNVYGQFITNDSIFFFLFTFLIYSLCILALSPWWIVCRLLWDNDLFSFRTWSMINIGKISFSFKEWVLSWMLCSKLFHFPYLNFEKMLASRKRENVFKREKQSLPQSWYHFYLGGQGLWSKFGHIPNCFNSVKI